MGKKKYKEHPNVEKLDWRLQAATWITKVARLRGGIEVKVGDPVVKYIEISNNKDIFGFGMLNPTALFLNASYGCYKQAENQINNLPTEKIKSVKCVIDDGDMAVFYEFIFTSIILAYTALEAFANEYIPDDYVYERIRKGEKEKLNKIEIERNVPLDDKLSEILPKIMKVKLSKRVSRWNNYKVLKNTRDRIIHMKSKDRDYNQGKTFTLTQLSKSDVIWNSLTSKALFDGHEIAFDIISHFMKGLSEKNQPRWFKKYPNS